MSAKGAALGVGYEWAAGVLRFGRRRFAFAVSGVTVADVGFSVMKRSGRV